MTMERDTTVYKNPDNMKYIVRFTNPETGEIKDKYFNKTKEICEFLDIGIHLYYKVIGGHLKCKTHSTERWKHIKIKKLDYKPKYRKLVRKTVSHSELANKFN